MPRESKQARHERIHAEALEEFDKVQSALRDERMQCLQDRRFCSVPGAQWEGPLSEQLLGRPQMEFNKIKLSVKRIINDIVNSRIGVTFVPRSSKTDSDDRLVDLVQGKLRADEYESDADAAYQNMLREAVSGGIGAVELRHDRVDPDDEEDERTRICIEPIYDADATVFFDLSSRKADKSDARRCWRIHPMTPEAYEAEYGYSATDWPKDVQQTYFDWCTPDVVYVADYYRVEKRKERSQKWVNKLLGEEKIISGDDLDDEEEMAQLAALGWTMESESKREVREIRKYIMDGARILDESDPLPGKYIPIVMMYGDREIIDNVERCQGHVRLAKDPQRLKNMQLSKLAEIAALTSREKPIFMGEQITGHEQRWAQDNIRDYPFLTVNGFTDDGQPLPPGPIAYTKPPQVPPALGVLIQQTEAEIREILGSSQQGDEIVSNVSTETTSLVQQRLDMSTAGYLTNYAAARKWGAKVWLSMAADVYVEEGREVRVMSEDGDASFEKINVPRKGPDGALIEGADFERAKFDVYAEIGPSSSSARQATVRAVTGMMTLTQDPQDLKVLTAYAMMNMEGEGIGDVRRYYRKQLVTMGVVEPTKQEAEEMQAAMAAAEQRPDPQAQYLQAEAAKAAADAENTKAKTMLAGVDAQNTQADTERIKAETALKLKELGKPYGMP